MVCTTCAKGTIVGAAMANRTVDELLDGCKKLIADNRKLNETYATEAKNRGLKLMTYESGQHLVGYAGAENNEKLMKLFHDANRHPRMKELYLEDFKNGLFESHVAEIDGKVVGTLGVRTLSV